MTLVTMKKSRFDSLTDEQLGWSCMEPTFVQMRGKSLSVKAEAIGALTKGQRALCMFRVLYDHARHSPEEFYAWLAYLREVKAYGDGVTAGLQFFGDTRMLRIVEEATSFIEERNRLLGLTWNDVTVQDVSKDAQLQAAMNESYLHFLEAAEHSHKLIATYIRSQPHEFVQWQ